MALVAVHPLGMLTLFVGDGEIGKSTITLDIAARITKGRVWPRFGSDEEEHAPKGSVLIPSKEDEVSAIIRPRLEAAGIDIGRIHTPGYDAPDDPKDFDPIERLDTTAAELERKIVEVGDVRLIIIDPITDFVDKIDMYRDDQVRTLLPPVARIAARHSLAIINIVHLNKKTDHEARYRGMGSIAFRNVSKSSVLFAYSVDVPGQRLMAQEKANLIAEKRTAAFSFRDVRGYGRIDWGQEWGEG